SPAPRCVRARSRAPSCSRRTRRRLTGSRVGALRPRGPGRGSPPRARPWRMARRGCRSHRAVRVPLPRRPRRAPASRRARRGRRSRAAARSTGGERPRHPEWSRSSGENSPLVSTSDAVVVGAGHNGLVAAILLAKAGWRVTVLERSDEPGGAIRTAEVTLPGFKHDLYAANLNLFMGSAFFREHGDEVLACGFEPVVARRPFGSVFPDGRFLGVSTDSAETVASIRDLSAADAQAWHQLAEWSATHSPALLPLLGTAMPSLAAGGALLAGMRKHGRRWPLELGRLTTQSSRELVEEHFESRELQALVAAWGMHLDFPPDVSGGALFALLETFAGAANGMVLGRGGARSLVDALVVMLERSGGAVVCNAEVARIELEGGRATAAVTVGGERYRASKAVIANLTPRALFGPLVSLDVLPAEF